MRGVFITNKTSTSLYIHKNISFKPHTCSRLLVLEVMEKSVLIEYLL